MFANTAAAASPLPPARRYSPFQYSEYSHGSSAYTIISYQNKKLELLLDELKNHKINYLFIDASYFTSSDLVEIYDFYKIQKLGIPQTRLCAAAAAQKTETKSKSNFCGGDNLIKYLYNDALVFMEDKEYIGGIFEMYETIFRLPV